MMAKFLMGLIALLATAGFSGQSAYAVAANQASALPEDVARGLQQAQGIVRKSGDQIWQGYGTAPFGFLFVGSDHEVLLCDVRLPEGFVRLKPNRLTGCSQALGPQSWRKPSFLAAMPAFGPPSLIVMGSPEATGRTFADWTITIFHEHFHQWQAGLPEYYARVSALGLADGDPTGMWMLNYPFPYEDRVVGDAFAVAAAALSAAITADAASLAAKRDSYLAAKAVFRTTVSPKDWRYFDFVLWQEGVARWTEIEVAAQSGHPELITAATARRADTIADLQTAKLAEQKRLSAYAFGAGEAMLLERTDPNWRQCYPRQLSMGSLLSQNCTP